MKTGWRGVEGFLDLQFSSASHSLMHFFYEGDVHSDNFKTLLEGKCALCEKAGLWIGTKEAAQLAR
jgi:hypothetical protein